MEKNGMRINIRNGSYKLSIRFGPPLELVPRSTKAHCRRPLGIIYCKRFTLLSPVGALSEEDRRELQIWLLLTCVSTRLGRSGRAGWSVFTEIGAPYISAHNFLTAQLFRPAYVSKHKDSDQLTDPLSLPHSEQTPFRNKPSYLITLPENCLPVI